MESLKSPEKSNGKSLSEDNLYSSEKNPHKTSTDKSTESIAKSTFTYGENELTILKVLGAGTFGIAYRVKHSKGPNIREGTFVLKVFFFDKEINENPINGNFSSYGEIVLNELKRSRDSKSIGGNGAHIVEIYNSSHPEEYTNGGILNLSEEMLRDTINKVDFYERNGTLKKKYKYFAYNYNKKKPLQFILMEEMLGSVEDLVNFSDKNIGQQGFGEEKGMMMSYQIFKDAKSHHDGFIGQNRQLAKLFFRDISHGNLMIDKEGNWKLIDYGYCSKYNDNDRVSKNGGTGGTCFFKLPEAWIISGDNNNDFIEDPEKFDSFSCTVISFVLTTGRLPKKCYDEKEEGKPRKYLYYDDYRKFENDYIDKDLNKIKLSDNYKKFIMDGMKNDIEQRSNLMDGINEYFRKINVNMDENIMVYEDQIRKTNMEAL